MRTALFHSHLVLGAKMIDFAGWQMPLLYTSMIQEHLSVRRTAGIFDLSHMGVIEVEGDNAEDFLEFLSTNELVSKKAGCALYTLFCSERGTCLEDLLIYKESRRHFWLVVNACNREKILRHLQSYASLYNVALYPRFEEIGILSVQGPAAFTLLEEKFAPIHSLKPMHFFKTTFKKSEIILARTGYTGEKGVELFVPNHVIEQLWHHLIEDGKSLGIVPAGLGARDSLRLEMGFALYGHELDESIYATESVAEWTVHWCKANFLGKKALSIFEKSGKKRRAFGAILQQKVIARAGQLVFHEGESIGKVTSGAFAPSLNQAIALLLLERNLSIGNSVDIQIRENRFAAQIVELPFLKPHLTHRERCLG